jgi:hypothetical protein
LWIATFRVTVWVTIACEQAQKGIQIRHSQDSCLDDGRNVLLRNVAIRTASTIKNSTKWGTIKNNTKWGTKKQPCSHPIHSLGIRLATLLDVGAL